MSKASLQLCEAHSDALILRIGEADLGHLLSATTEIAEKRVADVAERGVTLANYDPCMLAHLWIVDTYLVWARTSETRPEDGCPVCAHPERDRLLAHAVLDVSKEWNHLNDRHLKDKRKA